MVKSLRVVAVNIVVVVASLFVLLAGGFAQENAVDPADPPSRVARLSYLNGDVSFQPNGVDDWVAAALNRPLTTSDRLWTNRGARAELQTGSATMRLDGETSFTLANLDDKRVQVQIAQGVLNLRLRRLDTDETLEIDTPNFTLTLLRAGEYRIQVDNEKDVSWVTVRSGAAEVTGGPQAVTLNPGQQARFSGANNGTYDLSAAPGPDGFDQWCTARSRREENARSSEYVARGVIGYEDLDEYGTWRTYEDYGRVWVPRVTVVNWAPYHYGRWEWVYPWGWTWVDDAPWGFAPFHYGRWIHAGFGWAWVPGPVYVRPVYAPALVAWCGGSGFSFGVSLGSGVGWFPLGPREPFIPWYWGSRHYFSRVNITNTHIVNVHNYYNNYYYPRWRDHRGDHDRDRDAWRGHGPGPSDRPGHDDIRTITNIDYRNRRVANGVAFVDKDTFVRGRRVSDGVMKVPTDRGQKAPVLSDIDMRPDRDSVVGGRERTGFRPPQRALDRPFVSKTAAPRPTPLEAQAGGDGRPTPPRPSVIQTRTFGDGAGRREVHAAAGATPDGATPSRGVTGPVQERRDVGRDAVVHRPPMANSGDGKPAQAGRSPEPDRVHVGERTDDRDQAGSNSVGNGAAGHKPSWVVPRPAEGRPDRGNVGRVDQPRVNAPVDGTQRGEAVVPRPPRVERPEGVREHVNVDQPTPQRRVEVYRPREDQPRVEHVDAPQRPVVVPTPAPERRMPEASQRTERPLPTPRMERPDPPQRMERPDPPQRIERSTPAPHPAPVRSAERPAPAPRAERPAEGRPNHQMDRGSRPDAGAGRKADFFESRRGRW